MPGKERKSKLAGPRGRDQNVAVAELIKSKPTEYPGIMQEWAALVLARDRFQIRDPSFAVRQDEEMNQGKSES